LLLEVEAPEGYNLNVLTMYAQWGVAKRWLYMDVQKIELGMIER